MRKLYLLGLIGILAHASRIVEADDWPQWRGPQRNGVSQETGLLPQWPAAGPKLVWQVTDLGRGYSTPSVVGARLYLLSNEGLDNEYVEARGTADGQQVWSTRIGQVGNPKQRPNYPAARSTPTVDGERLYVLGSDGDLACLEAADGRLVWQRNLRADFGGEPGEWAYAESPLVDGDKVICTPGGGDATLVALDKSTGDVVWKCALPDGVAAAYASIIVLEQGGVKQYVQFLSKALVGVAAETGELLWRYDGTAAGPANIPTPVARDARIYSGGGLCGGGLVQLTVDQGRFKAEEVYFDKTLPTGVGGVIVSDEHLFAASGPGVACHDFASGKPLWTSRGLGPGALCLADGRLYVHTEAGEVGLVLASPDKYTELGRFTPPNQPDRGASKAWAYPVVANGRLYIRDMNALWCFDLRE